MRYYLLITKENIKFSFTVHGFSVRQLLFFIYCLVLFHKYFLYSAYKYMYRVAEK